MSRRLGREVPLMENLSRIYIIEHSHASIISHRRSSSSSSSSSRRKGGGGLPTRLLRLLVTRTSTLRI
jgi:hypothetical protein